MQKFAVIITTGLSGRGSGAEAEKQKPSRWREKPGSLATGSRVRWHYAV